MHCRLLSDMIVAGNWRDAIKFTPWTLRDWIAVVGAKMNIFCGSNFFSSSLRNKHTHERTFALWALGCRNFETAILNKCNVRLKHGFRELFLFSTVLEISTTLTSFNGDPRFDRWILSIWYLGRNPESIILSNTIATEENLGTFFWSVTVRGFVPRQWSQICPV